MSIPAKIKKFKSLESDFGTSIAQDIWKRVIQVSNYIDKSYPLGMVLFFHGTQDNLPAFPSGSYWKELDGTAVNNVNSPFHGGTFPDLRDRFIFNPATGDISNIIAGSDFLPIPHEHGGFTGLVNGSQDNQLMDSGDELIEVPVHGHAIATENLNLSTVPKYRAVKCYVRIA